MKKKIFSKGIYAETLRQLRIVGIIFAAIVLFTVCATCVISYISGMFDYTSYMSTVDLMEVNSVAIILFAVAAPVMTFMAFSYGNSRKASDYYHSLPYTRECMFVSQYTAVITWIFGILVLSSGISLVHYSFFDRRTIVDYPDFFVQLAGFAAAVLLVASVVSLAMSITGRWLSDVIVTILVLFFPSLFFDVISASMMGKCSILSDLTISPFFRGEYNIIYGMVKAVIDSYDFTWGAVIYSIALAVVYFVLALILFKHRKGETAQVSAPGRGLQAAYRILFALFLSMFMIEGVIEYEFDETMIIAYGFIVIAYFAYELITTRVWKNLLRAIPGLFIVALVNVLIIVGVNAYVDKEVAFCPKVDEIKSVRIVSPTSDCLYGYSYECGTDMVNYSNYVLAKSSEIKLETEEAKTVAQKILKSNIEAYKSDSYTGKYNYLNIVFETEDRTATRYLSMTETEYSSMMDQLFANEEYAKEVNTVPKASRIVLQDPPEDTTANNTKEIVDIYNGYMEEVDSLDDKVWFNGIVNNQYYDDAQFTLNIITADGGVSFQMPVSKGLTPVTYDRILKEFYIASSDSEKALEMIDKVINNCRTEEGMYKAWEVSVTAYRYDEITKTYSTDYFDYYGGDDVNNVEITYTDEKTADCMARPYSGSYENLKAVYSALKNAKDEEVDSSYGYCIINHISADDEYMYRVYMPLTEELYTAIYESNLNY